MKQTSDKYYVSVGTLNGAKEYKEVKGTPISFLGFESMKFFLHESLEPNAKPMDCAISEETTGLRVGSIESGKEKAIKSAEEILKNIGIERTKQAIEINIEAGFVSPRYQKEV